MTVRTAGVSEDSDNTAAPGGAVVEVSDLHVGYGGVSALRGVSLAVQPGAIVAVLGNNGAGKSTLLRTISGTLRLQGGSIEAGSVCFDGRTRSRMDPAEIVRAGVVQVPEGRRVFANLTVEDNLRAGGLSSRGRDRKADARGRVYELFPRLDERRTQRAGLLSGGEQQMLAIGRALMSEPRVLLLDEPSLGLSPILVQQVFATIKEINGQGTTVLLVEQNALQALSIANRAYVLQTGRVVLTGPAAEVKENESVRRAYLGED